MNSQLLSKLSTLCKHCFLAGILFSGVVLFAALVSGTLKDPALVEPAFWDTGY